MFSEKFKKIRHDFRLTQQELADKIGISKSAVSFIESGRNNPRLELLKIISEKFNISLSELINDKHTENDYSTSSNPPIPVELPNKQAKEEDQVTENQTINIDYLSKSLLMAMEIIKKHAEALCDTAEALRINSEASKINSETIRALEKKIPDAKPKDEKKERYQEEPEDPARKKLGDQIQALANISDADMSKIRQKATIKPKEKKP